jgi:hypothetical protein
MDGVFEAENGFKFDYLPDSMMTKNQLTYSFMSYDKFFVRLQ